MTLDFERWIAINNTREFLYMLTDRKRKIKTKEIRDFAWRLLKHYPEPYWCEANRTADGRLLTADGTLPDTEKK